MSKKRESDLKRVPKTSHAKKQMQSRGISDAAIEAALDYGRVVFTRGATLYVIGRKEIEKEARRGVDLGGFNGIHVVCAKDGVVITTYRNRKLKGSRPGLCTHGHFPMKRLYAYISI
jgi:hypothetical protein